MGITQESDIAEASFDISTAGQLSSVIYGEDGEGKKRLVSVDSSGRINLGANIDIGNLHLLDTGDTEINPATEDSLTSEQPRESRDKVFASMNYGQDTVATSGSAEALNGGTSLTVPKGAKLTIVALDTNTGTVYIGDSSVSSTDGFPLDAKDSISIKIDDVSTVYVDTDNNGEGIRWIVESG